MQQIYNTNTLFLVYRSSSLAPPSEAPIAYVFAPETKFAFSLEIMVMPRFEEGEVYCFVVVCQTIDLWVSWMVDKFVFDQ